ncbi:MAG: DNA-protecting protein DprA [Gemmatimonadetes bacterium]|nr:DNA-protecting protein DprA [Gemmatimonadota bacterium]
MAPSDRGELSALLLLRRLPGLTDVALRELLARHGSAVAALEAPAHELGARAAAARREPRLLRWLERALETIERQGVAVLVEGDPRYPLELLEQLIDRPPVLFARGRLELLGRPAVAIVGARSHTEYGAESARELAEGLARAGVVVISGMARGIDSLAHAAALAGGTIGVLGCGIDVVYPPEHGRLYERMATEGLLLSEFPPGAPALRHHFPQRNRLIAALARGVVVIEARVKSGTIITVDHALDLGREVFAVPGPIGRPTSAGTNALIRQGAALVTGVQDILEGIGLAVPEDLPPETPATVRPPLGLGRDSVSLWRLLDREPRHPDELAARAGVSAPAAAVALLELELAGHARHLPGNRFVRGGESNFGT